MDFSRRIKSWVSISIIAIVIAFPVVIWLTMLPVAERFSDTFRFFSSIGQLAGLIGMALFAVALILSARLPIFDEYFGGLDRAYRIHHYIGTIAFLFLVVHPLVLAIRLIPFSVVDAALFFIPGSNWPLNYGIFALILMMLLLAVTFFAHWRYQFLRFAHQILGFAFFLGGLHAFFIPSDISNNAVLRTYMLVLCFGALACFVYRSILGSALVKRYTYIVTAVNDLGLGVTEVVMEPESTVMRYLPGQFLFVSFKDGALSSEVHPFSISSAPMEKTLRITVKALGDWTKKLKFLSVGSVARIEGPFGSFSYLKAKNDRQIWVAGGIGVTPFLNMARNLIVNKRDDLHIDFYYTTKTENEIVFRDEFERAAAVCPRFRFIPFAAEQYGFLTAEVIRKVSGDLSATDIFVCGPPPMMQSLKTQLRAAHVPKYAIHMEEFKLL